MSETWPYLLILGYIGMFIFSLLKQKTLLLEEIRYFGWYLLVGLLAAFWANGRYTASRYPMEDWSGVDINVLGMFRVLWNIFVLPYLTAFSLLSSVRLFIVFFVDYRKRKAKRPITHHFPCSP